MWRRGENVPAWSPQIANEFIRLASADARAFDQMKLQELTYIAHGWCLAITGEPLTGDRPEAFEHGPEYRRLADALARWGVEPVISEISIAETTANYSKSDATFPHEAELNDRERAILERVYVDYGGLPTPQLATVTRAKGTPWEHIFASGAGKRRDIPHALIQAQFAKIASKLSS
jgi:uncharacterized phage-associated protein